jgi:HEAT repeat protein
MSQSTDSSGDFTSVDEEKRRWAIIDASKRADVSQLPVLLSLLAKDTYENRRHIVRSLGRIGGDVSLNKLLQLAKSESGLILGDIAKSLGQLKNTKALDHLEELIHHKDDWVKQNAQWAIKQIKQ